MKIVLSSLAELRKMHELRKLNRVDTHRKSRRPVHEQAPYSNRPQDRKARVADFLKLHPDFKGTRPL